MRQLTAIICFAFFCCSANSEVLPVSAFARIPLVESPQVSPAGDFVAVVLNNSDKPRIAVSKFASPAPVSVIEVYRSDYIINWLRWANDERLLVSVSAYSDSIREHRRLIAVNIDGSNLVDLWRRPITDSVSTWNAITRLNRDGVLSILPQDPDKVLVKRSHQFEYGYGVFMVDIYNNTFEKQPASPHHMSRWLADEDGRVTLGQGRSDIKGKDDTWYRDYDTDEWKRVNTTGYYAGPSFYPIVVDYNKALVISDFETRRDAVWSYDLELASYDEPIFAPPGFDVKEPIWDYHNNRVIGVTYFDDFERQHFFAESDVDIQRFVAKSFPDSETTIVSRSADATKLIIATDQDNSPRRYYWVDISENKAGAWYSQFPELEDTELPHVRPISFETRDGTAIGGYLTLPIESTSGRPPLVVLPHDGPADRDTQLFDPMVQFLANRGYAILQINFRGSDGFGNDHARPRNHKWGGTMQQDVYDGIDWLASQNLVNMNRICMVGRGYGGYVALTASYQRPSQFDCIVSLAGITDTSEYRPIYPSKEFWVGTPIFVNKDDLTNPSPIDRVKWLKSPILLIHGDHDTRVNVSQSEKFYKKARKAKIPIEFVEIEGGTHLFDRNEHLVTSYEAIEEFLGQYLTSSIDNPDAVAH